VLHQEHLQCSENQKRAEDEQDPLISMNELRPEPDHHTAHQQRAENPPEEHAVLVHRRHRKKPEDHRDDKNVVDRERLLDHVTREVFDRGAGPVELAERIAFAHRHLIQRRAVKALAHPQPVVLISNVDERREKQCDADPHRRPRERFLQFDDVRLAMKDAQIEGEEHDDERDKSEPCEKHHGFYAGRSKVAIRSGGIVLNYSRACFSVSTYSFGTPPRHQSGFCDQIHT
jgi:hypothetical protein